ncbi:MAG: Sapep family Mn(2+)-dependent dipeptidase [Alistipes sp.]|nr:Sapep family Mn(2+)-dependent dipeptidase [Alistipes sp.]
MTEIRKYLEESREEMISLLAELTAIPSVQGEPEEGCPFGAEPARALKLMLRRCGEYGFKVENVDNYVGYADHGEKPELGILTHLDVVPGWGADCFTLKRAGGRLIARGAIDDKGPAVASVFALRAVKELGIPLKKGVRLIFGTNEENGSADIAYYRKKRELPPMVFTPDGEYPLINGEKGMLRVYFSTAMDADVEISAGEVINAVPGSCKVTEGGKTRIYQGKSAHASTPEKGENAITKFLEDYCGESKVLKGFQQIFPHCDVGGTAIFGDIPENLTCVISMLNTVENRLAGAVDIRFPMDRTKREIFGMLEKKFSAAGLTIDCCEGVEPHYTEENSDFVQSLLRVYEKVTGEKGECLTIGGGTYVHEIPGGVAFGAEFPGEDGNMHSPDEFITEENLLKNAEIMAEAIVELCS